MDVIKPAEINTGKTEFIWLGTLQQLAKLSVSPLQIKNSDILVFEFVLLLVFI